MTTPDEQKGYSRGYKAGRRRTEGEMKISADAYLANCSEREQFRRDIFKAALVEMMRSGTWEKDGVKYKTVSDFVGGAKLMANHAVEAMFK